MKSVYISQDVRNIIRLHFYILVCYECMIEITRKSPLLIQYISKFNVCNYQSH